ncbi:GNAT family N-acetyltransferase [Lutibaculum baratangense]|uniref:N-acetyltransferase domain-containing protein n=1 Tax=Lutibaculum baratangense AMV1 TaxID=631454 RepID=V4QUY6_9HYPH|nr:GNAT family N-acetyltransferase [Lutibaculum baratangense]ESR23562.1 hypothetical protein N177_3630 [Lutibaculum baratangense AMV1]
MTELETERLALRPYRSEERRFVATLMRNPEVFFWRDQPVPDEVIDAVMARSARLAPLGLGWFAVFLRDGGAFIGNVILQPIQVDDAEDVEIGWHLLPRKWGQGYATEAAGALLDHGMRTLGLGRVVAVALPTNERSLRVIRRIGLPYIGERLHAGLPHAFFGLTNEQYMTARGAAATN